MDDGRWTMDDGHWTMDDGRWTMDDGRQTTDDGRQTIDDGRIRDLVGRPEARVAASFGGLGERVDRLIRVAQLVVFRAAAASEETQPTDRPNRRSIEHSSLGGAKKGVAPPAVVVDLGRFVRPSVVSSVSDRSARARERHERGAPRGPTSVSISAIAGSS